MADTEKIQFIIQTGYDIEGFKKEVEEAAEEIREKVRILGNKAIRQKKKNRRAVLLFEEINRTCPLPEELVKKIEKWNESV